MNWYVYCGNNPIVFVDPYGLDAIVITAKKDADRFGHMAALVQDEDGNWYYYSWAGTVIYELVGDANALVDLESLNKYLISADLMDESNVPYDTSVYIKGDFSASCTQFASDFDDWEETHGDFYEIQSGYVNRNPKYDLFNNNCGQKTMQGIFKGVLPDGTTVGDYFTKAGFSISTVPKVNQASLQVAFYNSAFTIQQFNDSTQYYRDKYNNSKWYNRWMWADIIKDIDRIS